MYGDRGVSQGIQRPPSADSDSFHFWIFGERQATGSPLLKEGMGLNGTGWDWMGLDGTNGINGMSYFGLSLK